MRHSIEPAGHADTKQGENVRKSDASWFQEQHKLCPTHTSRFAARERPLFLSVERPQLACGWRWLRMALLLPLLALLWLAGPTRAGPADPVWVDATGGPNASARDALRLLADAGADGLAPQDWCQRVLILMPTRARSAVSSSDSSNRHQAWRCDLPHGRSR